MKISGNPGIAAGRRPASAADIRRKRFAFAIFLAVYLCALGIIAAPRSFFVAEDRPVSRLEPSAFVAGRAPVLR